MAFSNSAHLSYVLPLPPTQSYTLQLMCPGPSCETNQLTPPLSPQNASRLQDDLSQDPDFQQFKALAATLVDSNNRRRSTNPQMRRTVQGTHQHCRDPEYLARRERNNAAAKRSRDLRSRRHEYLLVELAYLEQRVPQLVKQKNMLEELTKARSRGPYLGHTSLVN